MDSVERAAADRVQVKGGVRVWHKLALILLLVGCGPLAAAAYMIANGDAKRLAESARAYHLATAEVALGEARGLVARALAETRALGTILAKSDVDAERREAAARAQLLGAELVDEVAVYDGLGKRLLVMRTTAPESPRWDPAAALAPEQMEAAAARGYLARDVVRVRSGDKAAGNEPLALELVVPIWQGAEPERKLYAFLVVAIDLEPLSTMVAGLGTRHFEDPRRVRLLDGALKVLAASDRSALGSSLVGTPAVSGLSGERPFDREVAYTVDYVGADGVALIGAIIPLPELGWAALVEQEQAEAYAGVAATWKTALIVGISAAALALGFALFIGRRLARPVEAMAAATSRVAAGDFAVRVPIGSSDEIGRTALAFNQMAGDLGSYRDKLVDETRARENLSRFLSPEVVERIVKGKGALKLGGERREVTVLFADVVSFTALADEREPEVAVAILNELFTIVTEIVFQHGGIIDKFIGDCAMALWGAPDAHEDDARQAVRAAEAILRWLEVGNAKWRKQLGRDIELAIGIHTGSAVVGNIGSEKRMDYTAIGDAVNVAARLERLARPGQILMTRETMQRVQGEFASQSIGTYNIIGRSRPSEIFVLAE